MYLIAILCVYSFLVCVISYMQIKFLQKERLRQAFILDEKTYIQAADNAIENEKFSIFSNLYSLVVKILWLIFGFLWLKSIFIEQNSILENTLFLLAFLFINAIINLPLELYESFVKNKKQGFSNLSPALFVKDQLKSLALMLVFGFLLLYALVFCYEFLASWWWLGAFGVAFFAALLANILYPTLIAPLFNKMTPLDDESLKEQIITLMQRCKFKSSGIFVMDASKRDKRANAYFGGLFKSKRVVLFDTLLNSLSKKQLLAVLGHELGHFVHKDLIKMLFASASMLFLLFFIFAHLPNFFYEQSGLNGVNAGVFALLFLFGDIFVFFLSPLINAQSRKNEFSADKHGAMLTSKEDMKEALCNLAKENKAFVRVSKIYEIFHLSHPSIDERLKALT